MTNLSGTSKQRIVLFVSPNDEDHRALIHILPPAGWSLDSAFDCVEAIKSLEAEFAPVVIVERDLPDGNWKTLHNRLIQMPFPPKLIVTCRLADERLWAEVLNLWRLRCARTTVLRPRSITFHQLCLQPKG